MDMHVKQEVMSKALVEYFEKHYGINIVPLDIDYNVLRNKDEKVAVVVRLGKNQMKPVQDTSSAEPTPTPTDNGNNDDGPIETTDTTSTEPQPPRIF